ncbi:tRNA epoxyqueuosine(34) reductase QueG [Alkalitalea saponilacus]|uniref:Epoxyqueuosine reductase n=1 Tax=Alkalitalea saponilacus TaxID=889453 RepID=A0A1T5FUG3_9BACT|nr:tRNA epoxyqueuosine(34) reductase QueG [Alkalitalea saponilacus]ASB49496.1 tRNA epoxyqueuosine(34) reductase QueG [Alkalitalea saponilacus]SKB99782.1 epoxyqueuosine reductase [Alkalitalea saponilacus]
MNLTQQHIANTIRDKALELGFDDVGFSPATELTEDKERLEKWLNNGYNAGMKYMNNHFEKRVNPALLVERSLSVITVLKNYNQQNNQLSTNFPKISRYAYGKDYHDTIRKKLSVLFDYIREHIYPDLQGRYFVDSAPLLERTLAVKAGLGWIGKNSMLINRKLGSWVFIAELVVNLELPYNQTTVNDGCGGCTRCIDACPTQAILPHRQIDSNRCISYLTIENRDDIPENFEGKLDGWVFGCDICQEVCPWNRKAKDTDEPDFRPSEQLLKMTPVEWEKLTPEKFSELFRGSAVKRTKFNGFMRNHNFIAEPHKTHKKI